MHIIRKSSLTPLSCQTSESSPELLLQVESSNSCRRYPSSVDKWHRSCSRLVAVALLDVCTVCLVLERKFSSTWSLCRHSLSRSIPDCRNGSAKAISVLTKEAVVMHSDDVRGQSTKQAPSNGTEASRAPRRDSTFFFSRFQVRNPNHKRQKPTPTQRPD
jgi:hypothetical protein